MPMHSGCTSPDTVARNITRKTTGDFTRGEEVRRTPELLESTSQESRFVHPCQHQKC